MVLCGSKQAPASGDHVELVFEPHPLDPNAESFRSIYELSYKYLTTTDKCTVGHLAKYLSIRVKGTPEGNVLASPGSLACMVSLSPLFYLLGLGPGMHTLLLELAPPHELYFRKLAWECVLVLLMSSACV